VWNFVGDVMHFFWGGLVLREDYFTNSSLSSSKRLSSLLAVTC